MAVLHRFFKFCSVVTFIFGFSHASQAETGAPFPETAAFLPLLLLDDTVALAKGLHRESLGELNLPSGRIVALDPLVMMSTGTGFSTTVAPGRYQTSVYWFKDKDWGKRNAFATIRFSNSEVANWRLAITVQQDLTKLQAGEFYGYGVDAGMGAFTSPEGFKALNASMDKANKEIPDYSNYYDDVLAKPLDQTNPSRLLYAPPTDPQMNIAMFASGFGDGSYPSYFGYGTDGKPVILATTFFVVDQPPTPSDKAQ